MTNISRWQETVEMILAECESVLPSDYDEIIALIERRHPELRERHHLDEEDGA
jgi:uncharacterized membrane protein